LVIWKWWLRCHCRKNSQERMSSLDIVKCISLILLNIFWSYERYTAKKGWLRCHYRKTSQERICSSNIWYTRTHLDIWYPSTLHKVYCVYLSHIYWNYGFFLCHHYLKWCENLRYWWHEFIWCYDSFSSYLRGF
jgi:hypothetical protein